MLSFQNLRYGSFLIKFGSASHLYAGAMRRGRSGRTEVTLGFSGLKGSSGHASAALLDGLKVGVVNAAELVWT